MIIHLKKSPSPPTIAVMTLKEYEDNLKIFGISKIPVLEKKSNILDDIIEVTTSNNRVVYMFLDPEGYLEEYRIAEGIVTNRAIVYVGQGTPARAQHHYNPKTSKDVLLEEWIDRLRARKIEPLIAIWSSGLSADQAICLEADVMKLVRDLQSGTNSLPCYNQYLKPPTLFNRRNEKRWGKIYDANGIPIKK